MKLIRLPLLFVFTILFSVSGHAGNGLHCVDRLCMMQLVDQYFDALVANDPGAIPFAENVAFVENFQRLTPGEGLWQNATSAPDSFKIYVPDLDAGQVGFLGIMEENDVPVLIALRLKIEDGHITEAEHVLARKLRENNMVNLKTPRPAFFTSLPQDQRMSRDELLAVGRTYYDALVMANGSLSPFADECVRRENGMQTTLVPRTGGNTSGMGYIGTLSCTEQLDTGISGFIDKIDNVRVEIADPETGLVFGLSHFRQSMVEKTFPISGVRGMTSREVNFDPFDLVAAHIYKVKGGKIYEIEAMGYSMPYMSPTGWE